jgi:hypothetical protein
MSHRRSVCEKPTKDFIDRPHQGAALDPPRVTPLDPTEKLYEFFLRYFS